MRRTVSARSPTRRPPVHSSLGTQRASGGGCAPHCGGFSAGRTAGRASGIAVVGAPRRSEAPPNPGRGAHDAHRNPVGTEVWSTFSEVARELGGEFGRYARRPRLGKGETRVMRDDARRGSGSSGRERRHVVAVCPRARWSGPLCHVAGPRARAASYGGLCGDTATPHTVVISEAGRAGPRRGSRGVARRLPIYECRESRCQGRSAPPLRMSHAVLSTSAMTAPRRR
jgi:hypothetical protein